MSIYRKHITKHDFYHYFYGLEKSDFAGRKWCEKSWVETAIDIPPNCYCLTSTDDLREHLYKFIIIAGTTWLIEYEKGFDVDMYAIRERNQKNI